MDIPPLFFPSKFLSKEVFSVLALRLEMLRHFLNKEHVHFSWLLLLFARYSCLQSSWAAHCGVITKLLFLPTVGVDLQMKLEYS